MVNGLRVLLNLFWTPCWRCVPPQAVLPRGDEPASEGVRDRDGERRQERPGVAETEDRTRTWTLPLVSPSPSLGIEFHRIIVQMKKKKWKTN